MLELELGPGLGHADGCFGGREFDGDEPGGVARMDRLEGIDVDGRKRGWRGA